MLAALIARFAPYRTVAVLALVAALAAVVYVKQLQLEAERATSAGRLATIRAFESSAEALRADAAQREKTSKAAAAASARQAANARAQIESIQAATVPNDCAGAIGWMVEQGPSLERQP